MTKQPEASSKTSPFPDLLQLPCFSGLATCSFVQRSLNGYCLLLEKTALSFSPSSARDNTCPSVTHTRRVSQRTYGPTSKSNTLQGQRPGQTTDKPLPSSTESKGTH